MTETPKAATRLAPSPTGALHLGNARTFLVNWALARRRGWRIILRIEDLDGPRIKPQSVQALIETLRWLGLDWDEGPFVQSEDLSPYRAAMRRLAKGGFAFPCALTRGQIAAASSAPQAGAHELPFPPALRPKTWDRTFTEAGGNWRFLAPAELVRFEDMIAGQQSVAVGATIGDFIVWTKRGTPAYQLAVVVDDHRHGVTEVVRGDDLLDSAARQLALYRALGFGPEPRYWHLPLIVGPDGMRLAKRHGDSRLEEYRRLGAAPEDVIGLLARWSGVAAGSLSAREFADAFELEKLPRERIVFTPEDDAFLRGKRR